MHNMNKTEANPASQAEDSERLHMESLLENYPAITEQERLEILHFLTKASVIDAALLTCNDAIRENLEAFKLDNHKQLGITMKNWIYLLGLLGLSALAVYFLWEPTVSMI